MAYFKRMIQSGFRLSKLGGIENSESTMNRLGASTANPYRSLCSNSSVSRNSPGNPLDRGQILPSGKPVSGVDSHLIRLLEEKGVPSKYAKVATSAVTEVFNGSLKTNSNAEMQKDITGKILESKRERLRQELKQLDRLYQLHQLRDEVVEIMVKSKKLQVKAETPEIPRKLKKPVTAYLVKEDDWDEKKFKAFLMVMGTTTLFYFGILLKLVA